MRGLVLRIVGEDGAFLMGLYLDIQLDKKSILQDGEDNKIARLWAILEAGSQNAVL